MVIDTHIFLWYALNDSRLPEAIKSRMAASPGEVRVPSVCFWEAMILVQRGAVDLGNFDPSQRLIYYMNSVGFKEAPMTAEIAILSRTLPFNHADPADRFIAATAKSMSLPLATLDSKLKNLAWLETVS